MGAESPLVGKISNVILGTSDLPRSLAFYRDKLGLRLLHEVPGWAFFEAGGVTLALSAQHARLSDKPAGATEVVFAVEDVSVGYSALQQRGVEFLCAPRQVTAAQWAANFRDPDGHLLSIFGSNTAPQSS